MGLDAFVRCRCFEENRLKPGPVPPEDLYIDEDGYLSSRTMDEAWRTLDHRQFKARYGALEDAFDRWREQPCEHEYGEYLDEWVSNWGGCGQFSFLVEKAGGAQTFPLLSTLLPEGNGGTYPANKATATLEELDRFIAIVTDPTFEKKLGDEGGYLHEGKYLTAERLRNLLVASIETGNPIVWC